MPQKQNRPIDPQAVAAATRVRLEGTAAARARELLDTVCDPARLQILRALRETPLAASDLAQVIGRTRSATSQHLRVLREANVVTAERAGNVVRYRLATGENAKIVAEVCAAFDRIAAA